MHKPAIVALFAAIAVLAACPPPDAARRTPAGVGDGAGTGGVASDAARYEQEFRAAEALFAEGNYEAAIERYRWTRDHRELGTAHFEAAALAIVQAHVALIDRDVARGALTPYAIPDADALSAAVAAASPPYGEPVPERYADLQAAMDEYASLVDDPTTTPAMIIDAAMISLAYLQLDDAATRLETAIERLCRDATAAVPDAREALAAIHRALGEFDALFRLNADYVADNCGTAADRELAAEQNGSIAYLAAADAFDRAAQSQDAALYEWAGDLFYAYYESASAGDPSRVAALYRAGVAAHGAGEPETAVARLRALLDDDSPLFRDSDYYVEAMRALGMAHEAAGEPDRAVELLRRYTERATDDAKRAEATWEIAQIYKRAGDLAELERTYRSWRKQYGDATRADRYVYSFYDMAQEYERAGKTRKAAAYRADTITAWETMGSPTGTDAARWAGEVSLVEAEAALAAWSGTGPRATKTLSAAKREIERLEKARVAVQEQFASLGSYDVHELSMAAGVRMGQTWLIHREQLLAMPIPLELQKAIQKNPDAGITLQWTTALNTQTEPLLGHARRDWERVIEAGDALAIDNEWTQRARTLLHQYFPADYPDAPP